jgi:glycosyltransferase involved in cell wall biosynthesis
MKISIAVPSYNYGKYIGKCLQSIKDQVYTKYEVLLADGGSTDESLEIINEFCENDSRFTLVCTADNGQSDAIMKAFSFATGDIFCFLNSDDCYISKDVFSSVVSAFTNYENSDIISFEGYYIDKNDKYIKKINLRYHPFDSTSNIKYRSGAVLQPATFWRRIVSSTISLDTESHYVFDSKFFYQGYQIFSWLDLSKPVAGHRLHGLNKSLQIRPERIKELAEFEILKFGKFSFRVYYLESIAILIQFTDKIPVLGKYLSKLTYYLVNSISFLSFYRIPSI